MIFSKKIKMLRKAKGITQENLSALVDVERSSVAKWETGKALPSHDIMLQLSKIFDVSINELLEESDDRTIKFAELSEAETALLVAYRAHPEMHEAVHKLLGIDNKPNTENIGYRLVAFGGDNVDDDTPIEPHIT